MICGTKIHITNGSNKKYIFNHKSLPMSYIIISQNTNYHNNNRKFSTVLKIVLTNNLLFVYRKEM